MKICLVDGCGKPHEAKGYCRTHYMRKKRNGATNVGHGTAPGATLRFAKTAAQSNSDECIEWPYARHSKGYGVLGHGGKMRMATQVVLELSGKPQPTPDHMALHEPIVCHNPSCFNPRHFRWGLPYDNATDARLDGTLAQGERHGSAKITEQDVLTIRSAYAQGSSQRRIARDHGISKTQVSRIVSYESWSLV